MCNLLMCSTNPSEGKLIINKSNGTRDTTEAVTYPPTHTATGKDFITFRKRDAHHRNILAVTASTARARARSSCKCTPYDPTVTHSIGFFFFVHPSLQRFGPFLDLSHCVVRKSLVCASLRRFGPFLDLQRFGPFWIFLTV